MKAIVQTEYGSPDVLELREVDRPAVRDDQMLVRVRAASVHADVWHVMRGVPYVLRIMGAGLRAPKDLVPGTDLAGIVESVGRNVTRFRPGDEVFGQSLVANLWRHGGAFAEYAAVSEARFERKPAGLTFEQAAAVPTSGSLGVQAVRDEGRVQAEQRGVDQWRRWGAVGTFAVQIAKAYGANVTGVDAAGKLDTIRSIGADRVGRLRAGRLHSKRRALRRHPRHRREPSVARNQTRVDPRWDVRLDRPRSVRSLGPSLVREPGPLRQADGDGPVREPAAPLPRREGPGRSSGGPQGAHRGREGDAGHRQDLHAERGPRGHPLSGIRTSTREARRDCWRVTTSTPAHVKRPLTGCGRYPS